MTGTRRLPIVGAIMLRASPGTFRGRPPRKAVEAAGIARAHATGFAVFDMLTPVDAVRGGADTAARPA